MISWSHVIWIRLRNHGYGFLSIRRCHSPLPECKDLSLLQNIKILSSSPREASSQPITSHQNRRINPKFDNEMVGISIFSPLPHDYPCSSHQPNIFEYRIFSITHRAPPSIHRFSSGSPQYPHRNFYGNASRVLLKLEANGNLQEDIHSCNHHMTWPFTNTGLLEQNISNPESVHTGDGYFYLPIRQITWLPETEA